MTKKKLQKAKPNDEKTIKPRASVVRDRATGFIKVNGTTLVCVCDGGSPLSNFIQGA